MWRVANELDNAVLDQLDRAFHGFGQAKFLYGGGAVLGLSQFSLLPQLALIKRCSI